MKRTDLVVGESYSYSTSKYDGNRKAKVRVIDTEAVHRRVWSGYGGASENKDGIRVVVENQVHVHASFIDERMYETAKTKGAKYGARRTMELYDGVTDMGEQIIRVLPRYIDATWETHEAAVDARIESDKEAQRYRMAQADKDMALVAGLPEEYKEFFEKSPYGNGFCDISDTDQRALMALIIEKAGA